MRELTMADLQQGLPHIAGSPRDAGRVEMVVRRPRMDEREVVTEAEIRPGSGLVGDSWRTRPHPSSKAEITLMNARCVALLAGDVGRWPLAGDQLYVDLDLGAENLPVGTRLRLGSVLLEVSARPHTGCAKFSARFGPDALGFVNEPDGRAMRLRGLNARVVEGGSVRTGDLVTKE